MKVNNNVVEELINEETKNYEKNIAIINKSIENTENVMISNKILASKLKKLQTSYTNLYNRMNEIRNNKEVIKELISQNVEKIIVYRMNKLWNLIVITFYNGFEVWGTIKAARYKNDEIFYNPDVCRYGVEFKSWCVDNSEHCFNYNKDTHTISYDGKSRIYKDFKVGEYNFTDFNQMLVETDNLNSYPLYVFAND